MGSPTHVPGWKDAAGCGVGRMIPDLDIDRSAWLVIRRHGRDAAFQAAVRADQLLTEGDVEGAAVWQRIVKAIERLQAQKPGEGEKVH